MRTTQSYFSAARGHVAAGTEIVMDNGDMVQIQPTLHGWDLVVLTGDGPKFHANAGHSAHVVECLVYVYPSLDI